MVAAHYAQIEAEMLDYLVAQMLADGDLTSRGFSALNMLAQTHARELAAIIERNAGAVSDAVRETVERALKASDADDAARTDQRRAALPRQVSATVDGVARILARDNIDMIEGAKRAFLEASVYAITQTNTGAMTPDKAIREAVRRLERGGIGVISYRNASTGRQTVVNKVDVAVRRHVRTQIAQDGARMTLDRMRELDVALVEVSSHGGARPEHARWQGRVFSLKGPVTIDGVRYKDFYTETGYGSVDGLLGANCRHSFAPYVHGAKRAYAHDPKHPSGVPNDEVYRLTQKQRGLERGIREAKRELRGAQQAYEADGGVESLTALLKAQDAVKGRQAAMRALLKDANAKAKPGTSVLRRNPRREWAGDMPKAKAPKASGRKLDDLLGGDAVAKTLKAKGITKKSAREAVEEAMAKRGGSLRDFASLTAGEQQGILRRALERLDGTAKAKAGKHVDTLRPEKLAGVRKGTPMSFDDADHNRANPDFGKGSGYSVNCQSCVVSYEARRRGYDVQTLPNTKAKGSAASRLSRQTNLAWIDPKTGDHPEYLMDADALTPKKFRAFLDKTIEEGNRYTLEFTWKGRGRSGHIVHIEKVDGDLRIYDPQNGALVTGRALTEYLGKLKYSTNVYGLKIPLPPKVLRVDNMEFDAGMAGEIMKEAGAK